MEKPEQWKKIKEIVGAALEREPGERASFLEVACAHDQSLRAEIDSLLSAYEKSNGLSDHPLTSQLLDALPHEFKSIGPYRLIRKLGEGGMGQVWLAEQTAPVQRRVALKLIRVGMYDDAVLQRFQVERQSLAIMDHPAIAKVFDAGATPDGQPYLVMEYVQGLPITDYCDQNKLRIRERLELFIEACEGVQHAHQKAIIHRDLKPANILAVEVDGKPMPRIIDFGLAKATAPHVGGETLFTQIGSFLGTPGYMSPEQADPHGLDIDTRTDVYSLGVVLYELLTGSLPFDPKRWAQKSLHEVLREMHEGDPPRPSTKVSAAKGPSRGTAQMRGTDLKQLVRQLRGDLDCITMKAVETERGRRYGTPAGLAADIHRYLNHEPVTARPVTASYRLQKYVRRHRLAVSAAVAALVVLIAFTAVQAMQLRHITLERDRATRESDRASRITDFMTNMFKGSDPSEARGNTITAREILDKASKGIDTGLAKDPDLQARMMHIMGTVYQNLGLYPRAQLLLERAVDIQGHHFGLKYPETLRSMTDLGWNLDREGRFAEADKLERETLGLQRRVLGSEHPDTLRSANNLAVTLLQEGRYAEAERLDRETLEIRRRVLGLEDPSTLVSMSNLAGVLLQEGHYAEAEELYRQTLDIQTRVLGPDHPKTLLTTSDLAVTFDDEGKHAEAERLDRDTLDIQRRVLGLEHTETLWTMNDLAMNLALEGRLVEAEKVDRETLEIRRRVFGPDHRSTLASMNNLADVLTRMGKYTEAENLLRDTREIQRRVLGPDHPDTAVATYNLGCIALRRGRRAEALSFLYEAVDHGLGPREDQGIESDPDLQLLHGDPRFTALVAYAKQHATAVQKPN